MVRKIANESYRPLISLYRDMPEAKATVNITGSLTEILSDLGMDDIIEGLRTLARKGRIEFTGTAKYHPILPLLPQEEMKRQIELNAETNKYFFGRAYRPKGFFPPELSYGKQIVKPIVETGHEWFLMSGVGCPAEWPINTVYKVDDEGKQVSVLFRDDLLSNMIGFQSMEMGKPFLEKLREVRSQAKTEDIYVITALDAETFGHHIKNWEKLFLLKTYEEIKQQKVLSEEQRRILEVGKGEIEAVTVSELLDAFPQGATIEPKPSSWSTTGEDLAKGDPYPLWDGKSNPMHECLWDSLRVCMDLVKKSLEVADNDESKKHANIARLMLDRAEHSDQFWWASKKPWWDINMVAKGLGDQQLTIINAYRAIKSSSCSEDIKRECFKKVVLARDCENRVSEQLLQ
jgi:alpha-amylase/alpha-mannosidase (GH57 family)